MTWFESLSLSTMIFSCIFFVTVFAEKMMFQTRKRRCRPQSQCSQWLSPGATVRVLMVAEPGSALPATTHRGRRSRWSSFCAIVITSWKLFLTTSTGSFPGDHVSFAISSWYLGFSRTTMCVGAGREFKKHTVLLKFVSS